MADASGLSAAGFHARSHRTAGSLFAVCLLLAFGAIIGCREPDKPAEIREHGGFIAFVGLDAGDPVWQVLEASAMRYESALGGLGLRISVPDVASPISQTQLLRDMHTPFLRGVCIQPADTSIMKDILEDLRRSGVVIVTMMTELPSSADFPYVGLDELAIGRAMADEAHRVVGDKGTVAVLRGGEVAGQRSDRYLGFQNRIVELPSVTVLRTFDCEANPFVANRLMREYSERFPRLDAWVSLDDWPLRNREKGVRLLPQSCGLITYGPFPESWPLLADGTCYTLIGSDYERIAENALRMCTTLARGQPLTTRRFLAGPVTWTSENLTEMKVAWFRSVAQPEPSPDASTQP